MSTSWTFLQGSISQTTQDTINTICDAHTWQVPVFTSMLFRHGLNDISWALALFQAIFSFNHYTKPMSRHSITILQWLHSPHFLPYSMVKGRPLFLFCVHWSGSWNFSRREGKGLVYRFRWLTFNLSRAVSKRNVKFDSHSPCPRTVVSFSLLLWKRHANCSVLFKLLLYCCRKVTINRR